MEQTVENHPLPVWERPDLSFKLPLYLRCVILLLLGFTMINICIRSLAQSTATPSDNPFTRFADDFLGKRSNIVHARGFSCRVITDPELDVRQYCTLEPITGIFSRVDLQVNQGLIQRIVYKIRENTLRLGDLTLIWGPPLVHVRGTTVAFIWSHIGIIATTTTDAGKLSPRLALEWVSIAARSCQQC